LPLFLRQPEANITTSQHGRTSMRFTAQRGRLTIHLRVFRQGRDLQVLCGGGATHIGAVALAAPVADHPPVQGQAQHDAQIQVQLLGLPGHKEADLAQYMAESMAQALNCAVCVSAGVHYDNITREEITQVEQMTRDLTQRCIISLQKDC